jgi:hypothetical protein
LVAGRRCCLGIFCDDVCAIGRLGGLGFDRSSFRAMLDCCCFALVLCRELGLGRFLGLDRPGFGLAEGGGDDCPFGDLIAGRPAGVRPRPPGR